MGSRKPPSGPTQGLLDFGPPRPARAEALERDAEEPTPSPREVGGESQKVFTVGQLVRAASRTLEVRFPSVWVEGEISNLSRPSSGCRLPIPPVSGTSS